MMKIKDTKDGLLNAILNENAQTSYVNKKYTTDFHSFSNLQKNK